MKEKKEKIKPKVTEWCEYCCEPADKCKRKCITPNKDTETIKLWNQFGKK